MKTGVILLAYGGPNSLEDIPAFLRNVRGGQPVSQQLIDETTRRYRAIGGCSPLLRITRRLAAKLQGEIRLPVYVGMRHWHPFIADTVQQMQQDGIRRAVAICMAPHFSRLSIGAYRSALDKALPDVPLSVEFIDSWHTQPDYLQGVANNVQAVMSAGAKIIFTAHSLPMSEREPYESQLLETARLVAQRLALADDRWMLCYQNAPAANGTWLGPRIEEIVPQLAHDGAKHIVVVPIGFVADHVEVLYDIDIALQGIAQANGFQMVRAPMPNDSDALVRALADLVRRTMPIVVPNEMV